MVTVAALGALRLENLVPLRSYFYSKEEKLVVYDFIRAKGLSTRDGTRGVLAGAMAPPMVDFFLKSPLIICGFGPKFSLI